MSTAVEAQAIAYPPEFLEIVRDVVGRWGGAREKLIDEIDRRWRTHPLFDDFVELAVRDAYRNHANAMQHETNRRFRKAAQNSTGFLDRSAAEPIYRGFFEKSIGGKRLREIFGRELRALAAVQREKAIGHLRDADFCEALVAKVKPDQTIAEALSEADAFEIYAAVVKQE